MSEEPTADFAEVEPGPELAPDNLQGSDQADAASLEEAEQTIQEGTELEGEPQAEPRVNLFESQEFRNVQSSWERQIAEERRQRQALEAKMQETQRRLEEQAEDAQLRNADPDQAVQILRTKLARERAAVAQQREQDRMAQDVKDRATRMLAEAGLKADDPGLDWSGKQDYAGLSVLATSIVRAQRLKAEKIRQEVEQVAKKKARKAVKQTGAARPNLATGTTRPKTLEAEYEQKLAALKGTGRMYEATKLMREYREKGLNI